MLVCVRNGFVTKGHCIKSKAFEKTEHDTLLIVSASRQLYGFSSVDILTSNRDSERLKRLVYHSPIVQESIYGQLHTLI
jgi:hypothetical protein